MLFDYETLKLIWWLLIGVLFIGFALMDGFDMGVGTLLPFLGKNDNERRVMINTVAPHWDGNQVWFILAGGAIFAAWPAVYATAFSGLYWGMMLTLFALFFRPVGFDYRSKLENDTWRKSWDWALFAGSTIPPFVFGLAMGNLMLGLPFYFDEFQRPFYTGSFFGLFHPFAVLSGLLGVAMLAMHGATWLMARTDGNVYRRARTSAGLLSVVVTLLFAMTGIWLMLGIDGYVIKEMLSPNAQANPLKKTVEFATGAWLHNYGDQPLTLLAPISGFTGAILVFLFSRMHKNALSAFASTLSVIGIIATAGISLFPFIMPSSENPNHSLTIYDAVSSHLTLTIMFWCAVIFVPLILGYTWWCYRAMWGTVTEEQIEENTHSLY